MKIVQLDIQGFRSLKNVSWRPGDLNVIIGPNGSGKSNLLRVLELISAAAKGKLSDYIQSAGGISAIVWDGQASHVIYDLTILNAETQISKELSYTVESTRQGSTYLISKEILDSHEPEEMLIERLERSARLFEDKQMLRYEDDYFLQEETVLIMVASPVTRTKSKYIPLLQRQLSTWTIYQDIRTDQNALIRQAPVARLEQRVSPDGQNLINVLHTLYTSDRQFKQDINDAMFAAFGEDFDELIFPPAADQRIQMRVRWKTLKREQSSADLSDGTLRFLFLITVLASPNPPPLIAIDEPETGLHPSMLPIIAEYAVEAATRTQVIFTTHSDQFLDAFRDTKPTTTVAKWESGETVLKTISGEALDYWLQEYTLGSLFRSGELEEME